jgi:hypothetical protein
MTSCVVLLYHGRCPHSCLTNAVQSIACLGKRQAREQIESAGPAVICCSLLAIAFTSVTVEALLLGRRGGGTSNQVDLKINQASFGLLYCCLVFF